MGWLDRWKTSPDAKEALERLQQYPPYEAPFPGPPASLSLEAAQANLDYLLANRAARLEILGEFLRAAGIDVRQGLVAGDLQPFLDSIYRWAKQEWPKLYDPKVATRSVWLASARRGREIVYSLLMDVAILFGELVVTRRPQYGWSLDLDPVNGEDGMISFKRPVVQIPGGGPFPAPIILDFEDMVVSRYFMARQPVLWVIDDLTRPVRDGISGAYERYWLEKQRPTP